ncbi:orotidine 5'-phosphate decarboxylase / HUMPS family protein [Streptomyces sp. WM6372]|uniref:orotidine 5'-phosphate decarboxylase / HUMPS family protein n=1 Tax=Streptomyces sp. WM6372 TaxID=1415555 RepID=UPI00099DC151|nr:orotidine 5'-phosphate decarboxylase / HUMPS family protein [Streptomyces sp. WM6372]
MTAHASTTTRRTAERASARAVLTPHLLPVGGCSGKRRGSGRSGAVRAAGALGASMVTVHSGGGTGIMAAAVAAARDFPRLRVLALTVVTSMTGSDLADVGVDASTEEQVLRLGRLAHRAGCHGVIASPQEAAQLRGVLGAGSLIVTPGVTLPGEERAEHARPGTPRAAIAAGASHIVLGRSVTRAPDPVAAVRLARADLAADG